uniref:Uncharacterized protein n=1 Tax=Siphoviridae sp. ctiJm4 TaxID=2827916 RepID=A0A8S5T100_9CAUD|nr:MAG TPA: hypothetical protein [Siphoviridae sp. ctiJm4]
MSPCVLMLSIFRNEKKILAVRLGSVFIFWLSSKSLK